MPSTEKLSRFTLASLALNAGLIALLFFTNRPDSSPEHSRSIPPGGRSGETLQGATQQAGATSDASEKDWREGLRQSDIPRHVFIAALQADFYAKGGPADIALQKRYSMGEVKAEAMELFNLEREIALEAAMREGLGAQAFREWDRERKFADINTSALALSGDETDKLYSARIAHTDQLRALERSQLTKEIDPATYNERLEFAQADYELELRNLVGFQRYNEARDSGIPAYLRRDLRRLGISESQFAQIRDLEGKFGDERTDLGVAVQYGTLDNTKRDQEQATLEQSRDTQLRQILGEAAYDLYRKQTDARYQTMTDIAKSGQLTHQDVENVFQIVQATETEIRRIKLADYAAGLSPEETGKKVSSLDAHLKESLQQLLSPAQVERLRLNGIIRP